MIILNAFLLAIGVFGFHVENFSPLILYSFYRFVCLFIGLNCGFTDVVG